MMLTDPADHEVITTLRALALDMIETAESGHPGLPLGAAPMAWLLYKNDLAVDPSQPSWPNRDRLVLSAGHGSALLYALMHLAGFDEVSTEALKQFRRLGSTTPGHPERGRPIGVESTTGPLGQGLGQAVGMAIAERALARQFNVPGLPLVDHRIFVLASDGDMMEGVTYEAAALAGHLQLGRLTVLYDANQVTLDGPLSQSHSENVPARFRAQGWHTIEVSDGDSDLAALKDALAEARSVIHQPTLIWVRTTIGFGSPNHAGTARSHGTPFGPAETAATKEALGCPGRPAFAVPEHIREYMAHWRMRQQHKRLAWERLADTYRRQLPERWATWQAQHEQPSQKQLLKALEHLHWTKSVATRTAFGECLRAAQGAVSGLIGGDGDLASSTHAKLSKEHFTSDSHGRHIAYGVREHAMGAATCGIAYHGGLLPVAATFLVFSDYFRPALRLAALDRLRSLWILTHDSIWVGEDGPTHQPVEQLAGLRALPHVAVCRPADAFECRDLLASTMAANGWQGPVAFILSRQSLPLLDTSQKERVVLGAAEQGGYVVASAARANEEAGILIASGSEVHLALDARLALEKLGFSTRVVSLPSWEIFAAQPLTYQDLILPTHLTRRVAVEAASALGWERFVGGRGAIISVDSFGLSGSGMAVAQAKGLTADQVCRRFVELMDDESEDLKTKKGAIAVKTIAP